MPNYTYRHQDPGPECSEYEIRQNLSDLASSSCPQCGAGVYRAITLKSAGFKFRQGMKGDMRDYRDDLARYAGDPQAYVDGPKSLEKLKDRRKREGWDLDVRFQSLSQPKAASSDTVVREAYRRAKAKGFIPDAAR